MRLGRAPPTSALASFLVGSYHGTKLIGPSDESRRACLMYWSSYQPGPMLSTPMPSQRCLISSLVSKDRVIETADNEKQLQRRCPWPSRLRQRDRAPSDRRRSSPRSCRASLIFLQRRAMPFCIDTPKVSFTCSSATVFGVLPAARRFLSGSRKHRSRMRLATGKLRKTNL